VLPARNRMRRSADFGFAVRSGVRAPQPDLVVHVNRQICCGAGDLPQIGLIVTKSVGGAVDRHRVARKLRHAARAVLAELGPADRIVIRALPSSRYTSSARLEQQLRAGVRRASNLLARAT
jgi:ribonuclease P protein component